VTAAGVAAHFMEMDDFLKATRVLTRAHCRAPIPQ